jgi:hypothetical protein
MRDCAPGSLKLREVGGEIDVHFAAREFNCDQWAWGFCEHCSRAFVAAECSQIGKHDPREYSGDTKRSRIFRCHNGRCGLRFKGTQQRAQMFSGEPRLIAAHQQRTG